MSETSGFVARIISVGAAALSIGAAQSAAAQTTFAFSDVTIVPMDRERVVEHQTVIVRDGRIAEIGETGRVAVPQGGTVIDARGKFLIPGLGDAHAHLSTVGGGPALAERALTLFALNGVTLVRSMYTEPHHRAAVERVERGESIGPRAILVSPPVMGQNAATPEAARAQVQANRSAGYRIIKVFPGLSRASFDTLVAEAKRSGVQLTGHVPGDIGLEHTLRSGFVSVEHLDGFLEAMVPTPPAGTAGGFFGLGVLERIDESLLPRVVAMTKAAGTVVVPTEFEMELFVTTDSGEAWAREPEMEFVPRALVEQWTRQKGGFARNAGVTPERQTRYRDMRRRIIRELHAAGVPIAVGSDAFDMFGVPGFGTFRELETLVAARLRPYDALFASTVAVARLVGMEKDVGTIEVGKYADLVLVDGNPLIDISNVRRQSGVMLRGRWLTRDDIRAKLGELAANR